MNLEKLSTLVLLSCLNSQNGYIFFLKDSILDIKVPVFKSGNQVCGNCYIGFRVFFILFFCVFIDIMMICFSVARNQALHGLFPFSILHNPARH